MQVEGTKLVLPVAIYGAKGSLGLGIYVQGHLPIVFNQVEGQDKIGNFQPLHQFIHVGEDSFLILIPF